MAIQVINASGEQYGLVVNPDGSINVSGVNVIVGKTEVYTSGLVIGSIISMPSVSVATGSEMWIRGGSLAGISQFAGSIWSMPNVSVAIGSESWIRGGSIQTYNPLGIGSVLITNQYLGSEVWEKNLYAGSKVYQGDIFGVSGIVDITTRVAGSIVNIPSIIGSVAVTNQYLGSQNWVVDTLPDATGRNNPQYKFEYIISGTATGVTGSSIGSVTIFVAAGSKVSRWVYSNNLLTTIGSFV